MTLRFSSRNKSVAIGPVPDYTTTPSGIITMRRKTVNEVRFQALGTKNEKNMASGQLPTYLEM